MGYSMCLLVASCLTGDMPYAPVTAAPVLQPQSCAPTCCEEERPTLFSKLFGRHGHPARPCAVRAPWWRPLRANLAAALRLGARPKSAHSPFLPNMVNYEP